VLASTTFFSQCGSSEAGYKWRLVQPYLVCFIGLSPQKKQLTAVPEVFDCVGPGPRVT
jgi:hypothetical protein